MLLLDRREFDQNVKGGGRTLAEKGCDEAAADLLRDWREQHRDAYYLLFWHEGQERAIIGDYQSAIDLFERSRLPLEKDDIGWNVCVDGSIAFLKADLASLRDARKRLTLVPKPSYWDTMKGSDGRPIKARWPVNLNVLDGFIDCWGKTYRDASGCSDVGKYESTSIYRSPPHRRRQAANRRIASNP